jgi:hypothetical protein
LSEVRAVDAHEVKFGEEFISMSGGLSEINKVVES